MPYFGLIQLIGKYLFLAGLYAFIFWVFREMFRSLRLEAAVQPEGAATRISQPKSAALAGRPSGMESVPPDKQPRPVATSPAAVQAKPCLIVSNPGESGVRAGEVFPLTAAVTIGRSGDNSVRISDRYVSNHHAIIFLKNGRRILRDRDSTNGTLRNGRRVSGEVALSSGDSIGIGTVEFEYRATGAP